MYPHLTGPQQFGGIQARSLRFTTFLRLRSKDPLKPKTIVTYLLCL